MKRRFLFRIIIPAFSNFNIYSRIASITTALGPVIIATIARQLLGWDVEVIDENNIHGRLCPRDRFGHPDHIAIQRERPADIVGFYGSLTSTMPRLFELSALYKEMGVMTIAGGKHVEALPEEALANNIDIVVFGEGERTIQGILMAHRANHWIVRCHDFIKSKNGPEELTIGYQEKDLINSSYRDIKGIGFLKNGKMVKTGTQELITDFEEWPFPDFSLVRYAKIKIFPISGTRGCNSRCEFCVVNDRTRCDTPERMLAQIAYLVEVHKAREFFEASDHFAADKERAIKFCHLITDYQRLKGIKLKFTVQIRLTDAKHPDLLAAMRKAGITLVCIGIESPIDEELIAMKKGYNSKNMIEWVRIFHKYGFKIHGMFIFGYPRQEGQEKIDLPLNERIKRFKKFIHDARIDTCQVLLPIPLPGTELRARLEAQGRIFPLEYVGWKLCDGQFPIFMPDDNIDPAEMQRAIIEIMGRFYGFHHFWMVVLNFLVYFPAFIFPSTLTLATMRVRYITSVFSWWKQTLLRNSAIRFGGWLVVRGWKKRFEEGDFPDRLKKAQQALLDRKK